MAEGCGGGGSGGGEVMKYWLGHMYDPGWVTSPLHQPGATSTLPQPVNAINVCQPVPVPYAACKRANFCRMTKQPTSHLLTKQPTSHLPAMCLAHLLKHCLTPCCLSPTGLLPDPLPDM